MMPAVSHGALTRCRAAPTSRRRLPGGFRAALDGELKTAARLGAPIPMGPPKSGVNRRLVT